MIMLLTSCTGSITVQQSDGTINSGIPVYKKDDVVYCCEIIDDIYNIIAQDNEKKTLTKLERTAELQLSLLTMIIYNNGNLSYID